MLKSFEEKYMLDNLIKIQKKHNVKMNLSLEVQGWDKVVIIKSADFFNLPHEMSCLYKDFEDTVIKLKLQYSSPNVINLIQAEEVFENEQLAQVIPFKRELKKDCPYSYNHYKCRESDPKELDKAVSFINNLQKPVHEYDEKFKSYFNKR